MTSPSQLLYLDAMGIPVWVSRELVIVETPSQTTSNIPTTKSNQASAASSSVTEPANASGASNALENILQNLEQETEQKREPSNTSKNTSLNQSSTETIKKITETLNTKPTAVPNVYAKTAQYTVYAQGSLDAEWMVIGQNPEYIEHEHGQPYATEEGELLENMIRAIGIKKPRNDAYLVNVLRNSQHKDTDAEQSKIELNTIFQECIKQVQPKIIVIVGQLAAQNLLNSEEPLARLRGKTYTLPKSNTHAVITYYPSYLLSKPFDKRKAWEDLKLAMSFITE